VITLKPEDLKEETTRFGELFASEMALGASTGRSYIVLHKCPMTETNYSIQAAVSTTATALQVGVKHRAAYNHWTGVKCKNETNIVYLHGKSGQALLDNTYPSKNWQKRNDHRLSAEMALKVGRASVKVDIGLIAKCLMNCFEQATTVFSCPAEIIERAYDQTFAAVLLSYIVQVESYADQLYVRERIREILELDPLLDLSTIPDNVLTFPAKGF